MRNGRKARLLVKKEVVLLCLILVPCVQNEKIHIYLHINGIQKKELPRHLEMLYIKESSSIWFTKNRNDQAMLVCFVAQSSFFRNSLWSSLLGGEKQTSMKLFKFIHPFFFLSSGEELFGLQLHFGSPLQRYVNQQLEAAEVLGEVGWGGWWGVEQAALRADITLPATHK